MIKESKKVLSIQSHVAYGYAGNKACVFPMQTLGISVSFINTVQLSNHTQYPFYKGNFFSAEDIENIIVGLEENNLLAKHNALMSGYIGNPYIADVIAKTVKKLKKQNPEFIYSCDPVFGDFRKDNKKGILYASKHHPKIFLEKLIPLADIITPNLFELSTLTNTQITDEKSLIKACEKIIKQSHNSKQIILVTSCSFKPDKTGMALYHQGDIQILESDIYPVHLNVKGSGDITASIFLAHILNDENFDVAIEKTLHTVSNIFKITLELDSDELALVEAREFIS